MRIIKYGIRSMYSMFRVDEKIQWLLLKCNQWVPGVLIGSWHNSRSLTQSPKLTQHTGQQSRKRYFLYYVVVSEKQEHCKIILSYLYPLQINILLTGFPTKKKKNISTLKEIILQNTVHNMKATTHCTRVTICSPLMLTASWGII